MGTCASTPEEAPTPIEAKVDTSSPAPVETRSPAEFMAKENLPEEAEIVEEAPVVVEEAVVIAEDPVVTVEEVAVEVEAAPEVVEEPVEAEPTAEEIVSNCNCYVIQSLCCIPPPLCNPLSDNQIFKDPEYKHYILIYNLSDFILTPSLSFPFPRTFLFLCLIFLTNPSHNQFTSGGHTSRRKKTKGNRSSTS